MKGVELPISTIVVILLVLIVLLAIIGLFYGVWPAGSQAANLESVKSNACQMLTSINGCKNDLNNDVTKSIAINNFDADQDGTNDPGVTTTSSPTCKAGTLPALPAEPNTKDSLFMLCKCWYNIAGDINENCKTQVCGCST
jgi:hypothetical protein